MSVSKDIEEIILIPVKIKLEVTQNEDDDEVTIRFDGIEIGED